MSEIVDLDTLVPQACVIKFEGQEIRVEPPRTVDILMLGSVVDKLGEANYDDETQIQMLLDKAVQCIYKCVPALDGKALSKAQFMKIIEIIRDMATPTKTRELEAQGITLDNSKKAQ